MHQAMYLFAWVKNIKWKKSLLSCRLSPVYQSNLYIYIYTFHDSITFQLLSHLGTIISRDKWKVNPSFTPYYMHGPIAINSQTNCFRSILLKPSRISSKSSNPSYLYSSRKREDSAQDIRMKQQRQRRASSIWYSRKELSLFDTRESYQYTLEY